MDSPPRIVSLVPSWTETLLACGAHVVGRTRFCIHPADRVATIRKVGGTKDVNWEKVTALRPDLLVLDKEENTREIAEASPVPWVATRVRAVGDCGRELRRLAEAIGPRNPEPPAAESGASATDAKDGGGAALELRRMAQRWDRVAERTEQREERAPWTELPGLISWLDEPRFAPSEEWALVYLIWAEPWMTVGTETFIGSVLATVGLGPAHERGLARLGVFAGAGDDAPAARYPEIDLTRLDAARTVLLLSSEPYPFERKRDVVAGLGFAAALVDGESYSWFGVRSLRFLEGSGAGPSSGPSPRPGLSPPASPPARR